MFFHTILSFKFVDLKKGGILKIISEIKKHEICHIHVSNALVLATLVIICNILHTQCIFTLHADYNRFKGFRMDCIKIAIKFSLAPILLNPSSLESSLKINKNSKLISAFLPPLNNELLDPTIISSIKTKSAGKKGVISTNAFNVAFNDNGFEIYGVLPLIEWLYNKNYLLIVSDPSGKYEELSYKKYSNEQLKHVLFISFPHSFYEVLRYSDIFIRNTLTDGDSISIHEALHLKKIVLATSCVGRPSGVILYENITQITLDNIPRKIGANSSENNIKALISLYRELS